MLKIFLTDLAAYNKGFLYGEWISLPMEEDELNTQVNKILKGGESICALEYGYEKHEEYFITDYEWDDVSICEVGEYTSLNSLNEMLLKLDNYDVASIKIISVLLDNGLANDIDDAIDKVMDVMVYPSTDLQSYAYEYLCENYDLTNLPNIIANNINFQSVADKLSSYGNYFEVDDDLYEYIG